MSVRVRAEVHGVGLLLRTNRGWRLMPLAVVLHMPEQVTCVLEGRGRRKLEATHTNK